LDANAGTSFPGFEGIDPQNLQSQVLGAQFTVPLDETTVLDIEELEPETIDGVEFRVFEMGIDPEALMQTDMMSGLVSVFQGMVSAAELEDLLLQMAEGMTYDMTVFVNAANNIAERVEVVMVTDTEITLMGIELDLVQELTGFYTYSNFGEEVEIEAPDVSDF